ncbi:MAG TPA: T9SS type A sorting domain-containing protein [Chitinophagales bacterium]|nr:T9SS type A sorting domain-containing protein [Chitinophagales bacterium]
MKKTILVIALLFCLKSQLAAQNNCLPGNLYNNNNWLDGFGSIAGLDNGDYIAGGSSFNSSNNYRQMFLVRIDACGNDIWKQGYGDTTEYFSNVILHHQPGDNFFVATALHYSNIIQWYTYTLIKFNLAGEMLWMRKYWAGPQKSSPKSVVQTSDGGFAIVGFNQNFANDYSKIWFIKTDGEGNIEWDKYYGTDNNSEGVYQILHLPDDGYLILGSRSYSGTPTVKTWLIRTDSLGNILWQRLHGNDFATYGVCIIPIPDGYMISGIQYAAPTWQIAGDAYLLKTDINGYMQWQRTYGGQYSEQISKIMQLPDGNYMCMGSNASWGTVGSTDGWLFKVSAVGDSIWSKTYCYDTLVAMYEYFYDFTTAPDGGFMIGGFAVRPAPTNQDAWIVRTDSLGNACPPYNGCWAVGTEQTPPFFEGGQGGEQVVVYPNPAGNTLFINATHLTAAHVLTISLYTPQGQLAKQHTAPGGATLQLATDTLPSGIYYCHIQVNGHAPQTQKIAVIR